MNLGLVVMLISGKVFAVRPNAVDYVAATRHFPLRTWRKHHFKAVKNSGSRTLTDNAAPHEAKQI